MTICAWDHSLYISKLKYVSFRCAHVCTLTSVLAVKVNRKSRIHQQPTELHYRANLHQNLTGNFRVTGIIVVPIAHMALKFNHCYVSP